MDDTPLFRQNQRKTLTYETHVNLLAIRSTYFQLRIVFPAIRTFPCTRIYYITRTDFAPFSTVSDPNTRITLKNKRTKTHLCTNTAKALTKIVNYRAFNQRFGYIINIHNRVADVASMSKQLLLNKQNYIRRIDSKIISLNI